MLKSSLSLFLLTLALTEPLYAQQPTEAPDPYNECVEQTIQEQQLAGINNSVVQICSDQAKQGYEKQIVALLDQIRVQSNEWQQPERYQAILKSQRLWKAYVDQEFDNAGLYIGSPMYAYCPMQLYADRVMQLQHYVD
jgi:predicted secreted protein